MYEAAVAAWFTAQGLSIQHIASSEGTLSYTFYDGEYSDELMTELRTFLRETFGIIAEDAVRDTQNVSIVYCLGNDMHTSGPAAKAALALHMAGIDIHMITQGLNERVIAFLVDTNEAEKAVHMLHHILIEVPPERLEAAIATLRTTLLDLIPPQDS